MKSATLNELRKELQALSAKQLQDLCIRLGKYKKDNKELLTFLLFEADDERTYIQNIKEEIDELFTQVNKSSVYLAKKTLRKIVRTAGKYIRYSESKTVEIEVLIYFCQQVKRSGIAIHSSAVLENLYEQQLKKIRKALSTLHEDLQYDYRQELEDIS
ncbi:MAG TPA: hypothetical protein VK750_01895 [Cytophagaceae bacterium]|jgi:hypothetical protein|nr:hypothetical protein [Cytophagaceae bacterium]